MEVKANVFIDAYQEGELIAHREVHNVLCNTGRLLAVQRLMGTIQSSDFYPLNTFLVGSGGGTPGTESAYTTSLANEVLRVTVSTSGCNFYPKNPNVPPYTDPIYLLINSTCISSNISTDVYSNTINEAGIASINPATPESSDYALMVYANFEAIPFPITPAVTYSVTWLIYCSR